MPDQSSPMPPEEPALILTGDGSHTIRDPLLKEHYHSLHGAMMESLHVFITAGFLHAFDHFGSAAISVLEVGFGTGLNALLTQAEAERKGVQVDYTAIESSPLPESVWTKLNYPAMMADDDSSNVFYSIHQSPWGQAGKVSGHFNLRKVYTRLQDYNPPREGFHVVFFDAFSPDIQPEMWTPAIFEKLALALKVGGIFVTYSVKGTAVRALRTAGFRITKLPGPPGKRHMLRAYR